MTTFIYYDQGNYTIIDGPATLGHAESYHAAAEIEASYLEARNSAAMGGNAVVSDLQRCASHGCIQDRTHYDTGFCCFHNEEETGCRCDCEDDDWAEAAWESDQGTYNSYVPTNYQAMRDFSGALNHIDDTKDQQPTGWCYVCGCAAWDWNTQGPLCPDHFGVWNEWQHDNTPLLAQCAALLDNLLGGPVIGGGIIEELRRVRAALAEQGW